MRVSTCYRCALLGAVVTAWGLHGTRSHLAAQELPADLRYEVVGESVVPGARRSLDVRLSRSVAQEVLVVLANQLRASATQQFSRTFIVYYLPGMDVDAGGWATSHFDPELTVRVLGVPFRADPGSGASPSGASPPLLGRWANNQPGSASTFILTQSDPDFMLQRIFPDGSVSNKAVVERRSPLGRRFDDPTNRFGEFYLIRGNNLEYRDAEGVVFVARPAGS